ncbi:MULTISPECIES: hypothetical protein [unclassified Modicisalibacter]|uniref:hypothetical protein n=1 Tax=unclassified Modicisalibacter TaxID=2679913 RepID=UPI001CCE6767|nr:MULTISPECIES: hypothetical protein [unclassified Modicisalibacter]MBZ9556799.1 hypothetical protein [Modicisalibacter sp. R2A 31.J]MBZ9574730.1 hypothetical protein [Modicisalibacter sp. MOD 31.J]
MQTFQTEPSIILVVGFWFFGDDALSNARSIYRMNDTYMDIRTFFDEWRGRVLLGLFPLLLGFFGLFV